MNTILKITFPIFFFLIFKAYSFEIPQNLKQVNFDEISFSNKIFKNIYLSDGFVEYQKFYNGNSISYEGNPISVDFGNEIYSTNENNEVCYGEYPYEICVFVFTDNESYYWSVSNNISDIYGKSNIIDLTKLDFINNCDLYASPSNSPLSNFFDIGLEWNVENKFIYHHSIYDELDLDNLINICETQINLNPDLGRNYVNLYHLKKYYYLYERDEKTELSNEEITYLISLLDSGISANQPDFRAYFHMGLLNKNGFEYDLNKYQRPTDERFSGETSAWMNYFIYSFNKGNNDVLIEFIKSIQNNFFKQDDENRILNYFKWYLDDLNMWDELYVQDFFMNFKHELDRSGSFDDYLFEKGYEEELKLTVRSSITKHSDEYLLIIFSDYVTSKLENEDYITNSLYNSIKASEKDNFLPYLYEGWKENKAFNYTKFFADNSANLHPVRRMASHDWLRWHYENARGVGYNIEEALKHAKLALEISRENDHENSDRYQKNLRRLERKSLVNLPEIVQIYFFCTQDSWSESSLSYMDMGRDYGIMAVEGALSMDVFNNVYAMDNFKTDAPYLCDFNQDMSIHKSNISFEKIYNNNKIIIRISAGEEYIYTAIDF